MYEMAGSQYLLVPAASAPPRAPVPVTAPLGWVAYALPRAVTRRAPQNDE